MCHVQFKTLKYSNNQNTISILQDLRAEWSLRSGQYQLLINESKTQQSINHRVSLVPQICSVPLFQVSLCQYNQPQVLPITQAVIVGPILCTLDRTLL